MISQAVLKELETLLAPLAEEAVEDLISLVRTAISHPDGVAIATARAAEALEAKAFIRS